MCCPWQPTESTRRHTLTNKSFITSVRQYQQWSTVSVSEYFYQSASATPHQAKATDTSDLMMPCLYRQMKVKLSTSASA